MLKALVATIVALAAAAPTSEIGLRDEPQALPEGVWRISGYGIVLVAEERRLQIYHVSAAGCVRGERYSRDAFAAQFGVLEGASEAMAPTLVQGPTRYSLSRLQALPEMCRRPLRTRDPLTNFNVFAATFAERYPSFQSRTVDWERTTADGRDRIASGEDLFQVMSAMVAPLRDDHVNIMAGERVFSYEGWVGPGAAPGGGGWSPAPLAASLRDYLMGDETPLAAPARILANRKVLLGRLDGDVGYLAIIGEGGWAQGLGEDAPVSAEVAATAREMDLILAELQGARGLIVDLRLNVGGHDAVALEIASRFAAREQVVFTKDTPGDDTQPYPVILGPSQRARFAAPVVLLMSRNTVSAGEVLALSMSALPQVETMGQPTRGAFSDAIPQRLPNGWVYTLSVETYRSADGTELEKLGLQPDLETPSPSDPAPSVLWGRDILAAADRLRTPHTESGD